MSRGITWRRKRGDTTPPMAFQLTEPDGSPINVSLAGHVVEVVFYREERAEAVLMGVATMTHPREGRGQINTPSEVTAEAALYGVEFRINYNNSVRTVPASTSGDMQYLLVEEDRMARALPAAPLTALEPGSGGEVTGEVIVTATEPISALNVVALVASGGALYQPTQGGPDVLGVARTAGAAGAQVVIIPDGVIDTPGAGLTPGATYWAAANGALTDTPPTSGVLLVIGYAADADTFVVQVGEPINRA